MGSIIQVQAEEMKRGADKLDSSRGDELGNTGGRNVLSHLIGHGAIQGGSQKRG